MPSRTRRNISRSCARKRPRRFSSATASAFGKAVPAWEDAPVVLAGHLSPEEWTAIELVAAHLDRRHRIRVAVRHRHRLAAGAQGFLGQDLARRHRVLAAGAAAGRDRLFAAHFVRTKGPIGAFLADYFGIVFSFRWTGAALSCGIMGFPLMVRPIRLALEAIDRRLEDAAATLGAGRFWVFLTITLPLALAGRDRRRGDVLRPRARRIRRHHHLRLQHSRRDADDFRRDLHPVAGSRRRSGGRTAGAGRDRAGARRAHRSEWFARRAGMRFQGE
jgi:hypothetical protein